MLFQILCKQNFHFKVKTLKIRMDSKNIIPFIKDIFQTNKQYINHKPIVEIGEALLSSDMFLSDDKSIENLLHHLDEFMMDDYGIKFIYEELNSGILDARLALFGMLRMVYYQINYIFEICADEGDMSICSDKFRVVYRITGDKIVYNSRDNTELTIYKKWKKFVDKVLIPEFLVCIKKYEKIDHKLMCDAYAIIVALELSKRYDDDPWGIIKNNEVYEDVYTMMQHSLHDHLTQFST